MIFDQATGAQWEAARIFGGATMVAFLAARMFRRQAQWLRIAVAILYIAGVLGFVAYVLL
ncbi:hypothetical protein [Acidisphaera sp. S103]|uniref:hypothetical protein n=1 Tax=Acidisphaera sp. S103 TaxID=1747223 RepID=UPI00131EB44C|nr:hypothetical protein [Acidisphaera sp. S103]